MKEIRKEIMKKIALSHKENQKRPERNQKVNLFVIWKDMEISYSEFIDEILSLEALEYLYYTPAESSTPKINTEKGDVAQEFVILTSKGKSFLEVECGE